MKFLNLKGKTASTDSRGLWSSSPRKVKLIEAKLFCPYTEDEYEEDALPDLRVRFYLNSWNPDKDGLIYTDPGWLKDFKKVLLAKGFSPKAVRGVEYSEQGMQGDNYVSLDISKVFLAEWQQKKLGIHFREWEPKHSHKY